MADGYLTFDTKLNTSGFQKGIGSISSMFGELAAAAGVALSVAAVVQFGKAAVQAASDMQAKFKGLEFLMNANGRSMQQATSFIQEFTADGLVPMTSAYEAYKNMVSRGYETDQIEKMLNVMKDAAVYARQGQFSMGEAIEKTTMGLRMENSLLTDSVGIQKNVAKMWQEYAREIGTTANNLTMAQKRQAEFNGFMREGGVFAGAAAGYTNTYAGRMAKLSASFLNLKVSVGNAIIPVINAILPYISAAIDYFTRLFNVVGRVMNLLFGTNVGMVDAQAAMAQNAQATADATKETADNTERAGKAAKGALAAFDKLNVLSQDTAGGGGVPPVGEGGLPSPAEAGGLNAELDTLALKLAKISGMIKDAFQAGDFSQLGLQLSNGIISALTSAREAIQNFDFSRMGADAAAGFDRVVNSVKTFLDNINFLQIGRQYAGLISDVLKGVLDTVIGFLQNVDWQNVGTTIWTGITSAIAYVWGLITGADWGGIISRLFELLGSALGAAAALIEGLGKAIWESLKQAWTKTLEYFQGFKDEAGGDIWQGLLDGIVNAAVGIYEFFRDKIVKPFIDGFKKAFGIASPSTVMAEQGTDIIDGLKQGIEDAWNAAKGWFDEKIIAPLKGWFSEAWDNIKGFATDTWTDIETVWTTVSTWFYDNVTEPVKTFFSDAWTDIKGFFTGAWDDIQLTWNTVSTWFYDNVTEPTKTFFSNAWTDIKGFFTGTWDDVQLVWTTVSTWFYDNVTEPVKGFFSDAWGSISGFITGAWDDIQLVWNTASNWFSDNVIEPIKDAFDTAFQEIKGFVESPFTNLETFVKGVFNGVIGFLNGLLTGLTSGINSVINALNGISFSIPDWVPLFGGQSFGVNLPNVSAPQIPLLATGAVIPPNAPFMAVVGDQRSGTNIEAPESLIRQIVREEVGGMGNQNITITFGGTMGELVRQLKPHIERENSRVGNTMLAQAVRVS